MYVLLSTTERIDYDDIRTLLLHICIDAGTEWVLAAEDIAANDSVGLAMSIVYLPYTPPESP